MLVLKNFYKMSRRIMGNVFKIQGALKIIMIKRFLDKTYSKHREFSKINLIKKLLILSKF